MEAQNGEHYLGDSRAFVHESCEADTEEPRTDSDADSETELKQKVHKVHSPEQEEYEAFDPEDRGVLDPVSEDPLVEEEEELSENAQTPKQQEEEEESEELELGDRGEFDPVCEASGAFDPGCEASGADWEVSELRHRARSLKQELEQCKAELSKLQKRLSQSERVQRNTESYNQDLRKQVEQLSAELHERKKREKDKSDAETQTEEYTWTEEDYYNYYYGGYYQDAAAEGAGAEGAAQGTPLPPGVQPEEGGLADDKPVTVETAESVEGDATAPPIDAGGDANATETTATQEVDGSISDMLRSTAEEAMCQTGFVFDENTGMYYDHSTGFYYDSVNQLYYDNNTGIYYYYDAESGKYEFHSRVELQSDTSTTERSYSEWKSWKLKKLMSELKSEIKNKPKDDKDKAKKDPKEDLRTSHKKPQEQRKPRAKSRSRSRSRSRSPGRKRRNSPKLRGDERCKYRDESPYEDRDRSRSRSRSRSRTRSRDKSRSRRRRREERRRRRRRRREETRSDGSDVNSEPEEGELSESERENTPSSRGSEERGDEDRGKERGRRGRGGRRGDEERGKDRGRRDRGGRRGDEELGEEEALEEMELELDAAQGAWPPCVRVTVVRSPVLQVGTLFILTADATATIGREKDMDHAIRISEMGVSKFHAEVFFDLELQCYMIVDQGSQNGTVINGNRILQPKQKSAPHPLSHGDEVRMGDTVLSFHIHRGTDTCDGCEPGQILAHLSKHPRPQPGGAVISSSSREDKEALRVKELKNLKAKYGIQSNEESSALRNSRYKDRAESRRQTVGSEGAFQRDDAPASVHQEISEGNKGRKMLEKMGWKKGEGLGKEGSGIRDPIELKIRKAQSGLGAAAAVAVDDASLNKTKNQKNWDKARERFAETYTGRSAPPAGEEGGTAAWVRGPTEGAPQS